MDESAYGGLGALRVSSVRSRNPTRMATNLDSGSDDSDLLGRQVLPVANLPNDFDGEPVDGMQYLFTVRYASSLLQ